ncbi:MAG TPA: 50S ribosomal protein L17 [Candidatus Eisenbacteria bacterium]|nr:50S ribosomal protein L17 [Candidatus Eisenbacteria bacterium]
MRHRKAFKKLSRTREHRRALLRNLVTSLFIHERIETTVVKAKESRRLGERMITFAKRGDLAARRHVARFVHGDDVVKKLFETVAPWYADRNGGYTRIVRVGRRLGDAGETALLELVKSPELKERLRREAEERIKAEKAAAKETKGAGKAKKAAAAATAEGGAPEAPVKKGRAEKKPKPPRAERGGKGPQGSKASTRARQKGRSGT